MRVDNKHNPTRCTGTPHCCVSHSVLCYTKPSEWPRPRLDTARSHRASAPSPLELWRGRRPRPKRGQKSDALQKSDAPQIARSSERARERQRASKRETASEQERESGRETHRNPRLAGGLGLLTRWPAGAAATSTGRTSLDGMVLATEHAVEPVRQCSNPRLPLRSTTRGTKDENIQI